MPEANISDLIHGCINGDRACFSQLVEIYSGRLYGFYIRMGYAPDIAEDLVQELFLRLGDKLKKYQEGGQFEAWLFRVAANMARDFSRKRTIKTVSLHMSTNDGEVSDLEIADNRQKTPDHKLEEQELQEKLNLALAQLSEEEREFILMRHYSQMGYKDIAQVSGLPIGTVLSKVHRGLRKIKGILS